MKTAEETAFRLAAPEGLERAAYLFPADTLSPEAVFTVLRRSSRAGGG